MSAAGDFGTRFGLRGLRPEQQTVPWLLNRQAEEHGGRPFVRTPEGSRSFTQVRDQVAARAGALRAAGVEPGDRVAALSSNRWELLELELACGWLGAASVPINTAARGPQLEHVLRSSGAGRILAEPELLGALAGLADPGAVPGTVWVTEPPDEDPGIELEPYPAPGDPAEPAEVGPGDTLAVLYTSGTTGPSKGVRCSHAQLYWFGINVAELLEITEEDVLYTCLPLFHTNALNCFFQALVTGAGYHLDTRFSASRFWSRISSSGATVTYLLGAMIPILLSREPEPQERDHRLRVINGPAPPPDIDREMRERFGVGVAECYASTETNCVIGVPLAEQRLGWMGREMPGFEVRVVDEHDSELPADEPGELVVRHREPFAMADGYLNMDAATVEAWRNLWFHTGDRVVRDEQGYLRFLDRLKDSIRRRGENISSSEVEQVLLTHPAVSDAAVFAVPSELGEDEVMAAVIPAEGAELDPLELIRHCEPQLAYFAIPRYVDLVTELPLTQNGKVRKAVLRERGIGEDTWDLEESGYRLQRPSR